MAEEDIVDYDDDDNFDWLYVEDDYPLADELAEMQIPSPGYAGTAYELAYESYEFDIFDYWMDLKYGDDVYWDSEGVRQKRKRGAVNSNGFVEKRRKLSLKDTEGGNVRFISVAARMEMAARLPPVAGRLSSFALLPDWRQRFVGASGKVAEKAMPVEMKRAAESTVDETPPKERQFRATSAEEDDEKNEEMYENDFDGDEETLEGLHDLEHNEAILKTMLKDKLKGTPFQGMDEGVFLKTMTEMLTGDGVSETLGVLANGILGQAADGNDPALSGWLSQQGVSLDAADDGFDEEDEDAETSVEAGPSKSAGNALQDLIQASPQDSAIGMSKGATAELALHGSSPFSSTKKRKADDAEAESAKKAKNVSFETTNGPAARQASGPSATEQSAQDDEEAIRVTAAPELNHDSITVAHISATEIDDSITVTSSKKANAKAVKNNKKRSASTNALEDEANPPEPEASADDNIDVEPKPKRGNSVKQTRKRKADADDEQDFTSGPTQRKQPRRAATVQANAELEATGRRTRAARSRAGR